jgi:type IV pilus assembly protein PilY1
MRMKTAKTTLQAYLQTFGLLTLAFTPGVQQALAAPGTISQIPLYVGSSVEPNVLFLADDSGSMDWGLMTPEGDGIMNISSDSDNDYYYSQPADKNTDWNNGGVVPMEEYPKKSTATTAWKALGMWRAWNSSYNKLYYNPTVTYKPWAGVDSAGVAYGNSKPSAARLNPYSSSSSTANLTEKYTNYSTQKPSGSGTITTTYFHAARYYSWTDSDNDGVVDASDAHTLYEITNVATDSTPTVPTSYPGSSSRTDCITTGVKPDCTYAEEIQNFANWFTYYRTRILSLKGALSLSVKDLTGVRVGYTTINHNATTSSNIGIPVASMNLDPKTGNKKALLTQVFKSSPDGSTPLTTSLRDAGKYFECVSGNIMGASSSSSKKPCPILKAAQGGQCQKNFTILMTDGFYNGSSPSLSPSNTDGDHDTTFDGPPYADGYKNTLADVAMDYYERDLSSLANEVPVWKNSVDQNTAQHMNTFTVAFGVQGTLDPFDTVTPGDASDTDPTATGFSWPNPDSGDRQKIDDLWHAAYNGRGQFYSAQNPEALTSGLQDAFASVTRGKSSSSAVAFNTTTLDTGSRVYQATFNPSDNWYGDLTAYDLDSDGYINSTELWHASDMLDAKLPADRVIVTFSDSAKKGIAFRTLTDLSTKQQNDLKTSPAGTTDGNGQLRLDYLRGDRTKEADDTFRSRTNVLGDIVYSNPVYVGKSQSDYKDSSGVGDGNFSAFKTSHASRPGVIYVGSNDGMLHGFSETDGSEVMAYVPNMLFSSTTDEGMHYLSDPAYDHRYYVDLTPTVADVYVGGAWRTILIGGYRGGGRGLFALDITDPTTFSEANANKIALWEFTSNDDSSMGYSYSKPTITQLENGKWAAIFGNGYNNAGDGKAKLFILYLDNGMDGTWSAGDYKVISATWASDSSSAADPNGLSTPVLVDNNGNGKADRAYAGDIKGNLWAFDLSDSTTDSNWKLDYGKPLFQAKIGTTAQPITIKPVVARNPVVATAGDGSNSPNILVFFGTGQYLVDGDKSTTDQQTFYGIWDNKSGLTTTPLARSNLIAQTLSSSSTASVRVPSDNTVDYNTKYGWYFDLPTSGERVTVDPRIRGDYIFFNTLIPDPNTCNTKGYGWLMALKLVNGGEPGKPVFDMNNDGVVDSNDRTTDGKSPGGVKLDGIPSPSNFLSDNMYTSDDQGNIDIRKIDANIDDEARRLSWREVRQQ